MGTKTAPQLSPAELVRLLEDEPLIGVRAAAALLGMKPSNFNRDAKPRLTQIPVEGSASVYFRSEVEQLAAVRAQRRASRNGHG